MKAFPTAVENKPNAFYILAYFRINNPFDMKINQYYVFEDKEDKFVLYIRVFRITTINCEEGIVYDGPEPKNFF